VGVQAIFLGQGRGHELERLPCLAVFAQEVVGGGQVEERLRLSLPIAVAPGLLQREFEDLARLRVLLFHDEHQPGVDPGSDHAVFVAGLPASSSERWNLPVAFSSRRRTA